MTLALKWNQLNCNLSTNIVEALEKLDFHYLMPVQKAVIPIFVKNYDVAVEACTGSGKTLAFLVPVLSILLQNKERIQNKKPFALIITPTRELALQIFDVAQSLAANLKKISVCTLIGGNTLEDDIKRFQQFGGHVIIGTPGKLKELIENKNKPETMIFNEMEYLILDEADRLIFKEYENDLRQIILNLPKQRRTGLFSATLTSAKMQDLIKLGLRNPAMIKLAKKTNESVSSTSLVHSIPSTLQNYFKIVNNRSEKIQFLFTFLKLYQHKKCIVFFNTCASVEFYSKIMKNEFQSQYLFALHGKLKMNKRNKVFEKFASASSGVLLTTNLIARGIDFQGVEWIVQVDPPQDPESFIHRIGRTARAGKDGSAIILVSTEESQFIDFLKAKEINIDKFNENLAENENLSSFQKKIKEIMFTDLDFMVKGTKAFVSFIRSYKENKLKSIFSLEALDIPEVVRSFFLIKIPKIEELKGKKIKMDISEEDKKKLESLTFQNNSQQIAYEKKKEILLEKKAAGI